MIVIAPHDRVFEKTLSNMQEVAARGGLIIPHRSERRRTGLCHDRSNTDLARDARAVTPLVYAIPIQLIAYHTAIIMGTDVDQPRNLAKSVTVE